MIGRGEKRQSRKKKEISWKGVEWSFGTDSRERIGKGVERWATPTRKVFCAVLGKEGKRDS